MLPIYQIRNYPKLKKGFTKFDNEILNALIGSKFRLLEIKIILAVIRQTDGYRRNEAPISYNLFVKMTNANRWNISNATKKLVNTGILNRRPGVKMRYGKPVYNYSLNKKDCHLWHDKGVIHKTTEKVINKTTIKYINKNIKESRRILVDKLSMNK